MQVELRPINDIKPYEKNPRVNDAAVDAVAKSLREFGFRQPIVVDQDGVIVVGHTRWKAAMKLGLERVPVHVATELTAAQAKAYRIADNQTASLAEWDFELLPVEIGELKAMDFDIDLLGFSETEMTEIMAPPENLGLVDPDDVPEPPDEAVTRPGDLWLLGEHRLHCATPARPLSLDRLLNGAPIHLVNTDPPYNVKVEPRSNNAFVAGETTFHPVPVESARTRVRATTAALRAKDRPLANDCVSDEEFKVLLAAWFASISPVLLPGRAFYIWGGYANVANYPRALSDAGLYFSQTIIWHKQHPVLTRKDFMGDHEWAFYGWREGAAHQFFGPNNVPDLWPIKKVSPQKMVHLTEKPVELAARALQYSSRKGENVLDLFGGSGSTLIAAEQQGRRAFLMELDGPYCDVIVQRWQQFTGKQAVLEGGGRTFDEVAQERGVAVGETFASDANKMEPA